MVVGVVIGCSCVAIGYIIDVVCKGKLKETCNLLQAIELS